MRHLSTVAPLLALGLIAWTAPAAAQLASTKTYCSADGATWTACNPTGGGGSGSSNAAAGPIGSAPPSSGDYTAFLNSGILTGVSSSNPLPETDSNNASLGASGTAPVTATVGTSYAVGRALQTNCTTGGTITFTEAGTAVPWIVSIGTTEIPHATTQVSSAGAATCVFIVHY